MRCFARYGLFGVITGLLAAAGAEARIKLITLPLRERVEIQLDNESATLVEEERIVPLVAGANQIDFSWRNTSVNPASVVFRVLPANGQADVNARIISVSYPPNEAALVWTVSADAAGAARVRISYLIGGVTRSFSYRAVADAAEQFLDLSQSMRLNNAGNENFGAASVFVGYGRSFLRPIGLNETRELLMDRTLRVPIRKTYTADLAAFGYLDAAQKKLLTPMHYVIRNDAAGGLGKAPLPHGKARIFQQDGQGGSAFLGEDWGRFTAIDDELSLYLGVAQDVVVKRTIDRKERVAVSGNLHHHEIVVKYEIENFKDHPVTLDVREDLRALRNEVIGDTQRDVDWEVLPQTTFPGGLDRERSTLARAVLHAELPPRGADGKAQVVTHRLHLRLKNEW